VERSAFGVRRSAFTVHRSPFRRSGAQFDGLAIRFAFSG
jgi:hypothetical protein